MEQSYKEKYEDILARLERAKNDNEVCDERFCCVIDDIIPELEESEDEKIKKRITLCLEECVHSDVIRDYEKDECIAWLEKQKGNIGGISPNLSEEDEHRIKDTVYFLETAKKHYASTEELDGCIDWLKSLKNKVILQSEQEWSEEDAQHIDSLLKRLDALCRNKFERTRFAISEDREWLKSLKDRVQPKQEWSEEDEKIINGLIDSLTRISLNTRTDSTSPNYSFYREIDWLKSIRPQNTWKPSELQLGCLSDAIEHYNSLGYPAPKLKELLDDLKKLKEGKV